MALLLDWLLILCKPRSPAIFIGVENALILRNENMFLFPGVEHRGNAIKRDVGMSCH
jgi:hypothetical protein